VAGDDSKATQELFEASLKGDYDDEAAWDAVRVLRLRNSEEVFDLAVRYCGSSVPPERARGLDVLAQLGAGKPLVERPHFDQSVTIAIEHLLDPDAKVVDSAAWALAHLGGDAAVSALIPMRDHSDPDVRWAVANGLNGSERPDAIATLIALMDDSEDNVRDWATFALGTQCDLDTAEIQEALRKRLSDSCDDARAEGIWGLAQRRDEQGLRMLIEDLGDPEHGRGHEMAAAETLGLPIDTPTEQLRDGLRKLLADYFPR
jgi:HEAT repeat protein